MEDGIEHNDVAYVLTFDEFLKIGLKLVNYKEDQILLAKKTANVDRFLEIFGSIPCIICTSIWKDVQKTEEVEEAQAPLEDLEMLSST